MLSSGFSHVLERLSGLFLAPGSDISFASLLCALCVALLFLGFKRQRRDRPVRFRALVRAVFPRRLIRGASTRVDIGLFAFNAFLSSIFFGWAILSYHVVSKTTNGALGSAFGAMPATTLSEFYCACILTLALFLASELAYWIDHYLSHTIPFLWEFHKVHHTAEMLSPLTNFRIHPVDGTVYLNILALLMGSTEGICQYLMGKGTQQYVISSSNVIVVVFSYLVAHLHHTNFWIPFSGLWGRIFLSPAHHQIHHSIDPKHFNTNLGGSLAIWDWMFGTLYVPGKRREKLVFGVAPRSREDHTVTAVLITPVFRALSHIRRPGRRHVSQAGARAGVEARGS